MSHTTAPLILWSCDKCGAAGDLSIPPNSYGVDAYGRACEAHALASEQCDGHVRIEVRR